MAEALLGAVFVNLLSLLQNEFATISGIKSKAEKLSTTLDLIKAVLEDAEQKQGTDRSIKERIYPLENFIQESNMSSSMNDAEVCNKEDQKLKNDENSEDKFSPPSRQDAASAEPHRLAEMMSSEDMNEKSREFFDNNKVPLISLILKSSSEIHRENGEKCQASVRQRASTELFNNAEAIDTSSAKDFEAKHNGLNENEAVLSSCMSAGESDKLRENHSSKEMNYLQSESKEEVKDHMEREQLDNGDISEDSPLPMVTEVANAKDTLGESDKMDKNEVTDQELQNK